MTEEQYILEEKREPESTFASAIESFSDSNLALREFVDTVGTVLDEETKGVVVRHAKGLLPLAIAFSKVRPEEFKLPEQDVASFEGDVQVEQHDGGFTLSGSGKGANQFSDALQAIGRRRIHHDLLYRSSLIVLVSSAEWFLAQLIRLYYQRHPEAVGLKEKLLSYEEIAAFASLEDAKRHLVDLKIEEVMRGSFEDWLRFLSTQFKLSMSYLDPHKMRLVEIFQRRNLIVHNNGIVNSTYLSKVPSELRKDSKSGDLLRVSPSYLQGAIDTIELSFILIGSELWKNLTAEDELRPARLITLAFERLLAQKWMVAEGLSCFVMKDKNGTERDQMTAQSNYWQCKKWQGDFDKTRIEIEKADFSAKDELFQLARFALLDDAASFFELLPRILEQKKLDIASLEGWPIFREMRKLPKYAQIKELHVPDTVSPVAEVVPDGKAVLLN